jgi:hypothetical protein
LEAAWRSRLEKAPELRLRRIQALIDDDADGIYIHKRPLMIPNNRNGTLSFPVCGSVFHHCLAYVKQGPGVYRLEFGPADGEDVTSNFMQEVPGRKEVCTGPLPLPYSSPSTLPFLYCGPCLLEIDSPPVKQAIRFIESGPYHALFRNCIHAVDLLVRVLSGGHVINGPQLYDLIAGEVPRTDNPLMNVFQILLQRSWTDVCEASALVREMLIQDAQKEDPRPNKRPLSSLTADGEVTELQSNRESTALV